MLARLHRASTHVTDNNHISPDVRHAVDLILSATFSQRQDGGSTKFMFGPPGAPRWAMTSGAELYFARVPMLQAALHLRNVGALFLRTLSIGDVESRVMSYLKDNYGLVAAEAWGQRFVEPYASRLSRDTKARLAEALAASELFSPRDYVTLFPLVSIVVSNEFVSGPFFLVQPKSLSTTQLGHTVDLKPEQFPPFASWNGRVERPTSWLGVRAAAEPAAKRIRNAVLGAIALLPHPRERHMFTGRKMFGGIASLNNGWSFSFGGPCTPALSEDIKITTEDSTWLSLLASKVVDIEESARKQMKALEYYYRAWPLREVERFPVLFMALDAIFGDASQHTRAVADAVNASMGPTYDVARLKLLLRMRASVIHGGAPDVYDSSSYVKYYERYALDPIHDLELVTSKCIQDVVFKGLLASRPHTYAEVVRKEFGVDL